jgi:glutamine amidotransferase
MIQGRVAIIDYGVGNLYSVQRALEYCGAKQVFVTSKPEDMLLADKVILPGVGAFEDGMQGLRDKGFVEPLIQFANSGRALLGICLGMQLLASTSDEFGLHKGLDIIAGRVLQIPIHVGNEGKRKIPHIGWTTLNPHMNIKWEDSLLRGLSEKDFVYLVHSYYVQPSSSQNILATYEFDGYPITAAICSNNITGFQFHPEKSGIVGLKLINNFLEL